MFCSVDIDKDVVVTVKNLVDEENKCGYCSARSRQKTGTHRSPNSTLRPYQAIFNVERHAYLVCSCGQKVCYHCANTFLLVVQKLNKGDPLCSLLLYFVTTCNTRPPECGSIHVYGISEDVSPCCRMKTTSKASTHTTDSRRAPKNKGRVNGCKKRKRSQHNKRGHKQVAGDLIY
jgi:hypothetical protein